MIARLGRELSLWPRRTFDFGVMSVGATMDLEVCEQLEVPRGMWGTLALRVYATDFGGATSSIAVRLRNQAPSVREPAQDFSADADTAVAVVDRDTPSPGLLIVPTGLAFGPALRVVVQGNRTNSRPITATLAACLVLR